MSNLMDNPLHACDEGDRVEQMTSVDSGVGGESDYPYDAEAAHTSNRSRQRSRSGAGGGGPDPDSVLSYAVAHLDSPFDAVEIRQRFGISIDRMLAITVDRLRRDPPTPLAPWVIDAFTDRAHRHLWVHRC